jgi:hypothetical protein
MNGTTKALEVNDVVPNGGHAVATVTPEQSAQEAMLLKLMRVKVAKLDPASGISMLQGVKESCIAFGDWYVS